MQHATWIVCLAAALASSFSSNVQAQSELFEVIEYKRKLAKSNEDSTVKRRDDATTTYQVQTTLTNASPTRTTSAPSAA